MLKFADGREITAGNFEEWRQETKAIFEEYAYGKIPDTPKKTEYEILSEKRVFCVDAKYRKVKIICTLDDAREYVFSFDADYYYPTDKENFPVIVYARFDEVPHHDYCPVEEIVDNGVGVISFCYNHITTDNPETDKLADIIAKMNVLRICENENTDVGKFSRASEFIDSLPGKISFWAWGMHRLVDYLYAQDNIDKNRIAVLGHSRLGKTSLWAGANDERVKFVFSNCAGCMGDALIRTKQENSETNERICETFYYWFSKKFVDTVKLGKTLPFDMDMLLALSAPRTLATVAADEDLWADPYSQGLAIKSAKFAWEIFGQNNIYHNLRHGIHYHSRHDWQFFIDILKN